MQDGHWPDPRIVPRRLRRVQVAEVGLFVRRNTSRSGMSDISAALAKNLESSWREELGLPEAPKLPEAPPTEAERAARVFTSRADTVAVLSRYEVALERSLYGALHELERLQAARGL